MTELKHSDPALAGYQDVLFMWPNARIVLDPTGTLRFRARTDVAQMVDSLDQFGVSLNDLVPRFASLSLEDLCQFYQDIGYSLEGFLELSAVQEMLK